MSFVEEAKQDVLKLFVQNERVLQDQPEILSYKVALFNIENNKEQFETFGSKEEIINTAIDTAKADLRSYRKSFKEIHKDLDWAISFVTSALAGVVSAVIAISVGVLSQSGWIYSLAVFVGIVVGFVLAKFIKMHRFYNKQ